MRNIPPFLLIVRYSQFFQMNGKVFILNTVIACPFLLKTVAAKVKKERGVGGEMKEDERAGLK